MLRVTFKSTDSRDINVRCGWGWRLPLNPERGPDGKITEKEREVRNLVESKASQTRDVLRVKTYAYWAPFNHKNVTVDLGRPGTGVEFNSDGAELDVYPYGAIEIVEDEPIVAVTVIGSGCSANGYVILEAEPLEWKFPRTAVRMRANNLHGVHVRGDAWMAGIREDWNDAGMNSARFDIPASRRVFVGGGSGGWAGVRWRVGGTCPESLVHL